MKQATHPDYTVAVVGNYADAAASPLRSILTQRLMYVKNRVQPQRVVILQAAPDPLQALAGRVAASLRLTAVVEPKLADPDFRNLVDLVIQVQVIPGDGTADELVDELDNLYQQSTEPWSDNDRKHEVKVEIGRVDKLFTRVDLNQTILPAQPEAQNLDYLDTVSEVEEWKLKNVRETNEPTHDRDLIPQYGPGVLPDGNMAGGQQQS